MYEIKHAPWPFVVLAVLIFLLVAAALFLATRLTVAPRAGETVEVDTDTLSPAIGEPGDGAHSIKRPDTAVCRVWPFLFGKITPP